MKRSEIYFSVALIPLDFLALLASFTTAYYLRDTTTFFFSGDLGGLSSKIQYNPLSSILPFSQYLHYLWYIIPGMLLIFALSGLYKIRSRTPFWQRFIQIIFGISIGEFFILLLFFLKGNFFLPRSTIVYSWILSIVAVTLLRQIVILFQRFLRRFNVGVVQVAVIGGSSVAKEVIRNLSTQSAYSIAYTTEAKSVESIIKALENTYLDELIVVNEQYTVEDLIHLRNYCLDHRIAFSFVPSLLSALGESVFTVRTERNVPMIEIRPTPLEGWGRVFKRLFDIVVSSILIVLFSPLYLILAVIMKITSPGPLLIHHARIGRDGKTIYISKFRSMKLDWTDQDGEISKPFAEYLATHPEAAKEWQETVKLRNDPRISSVGKVLRKARLDELPQFFDVLMGSLSLVGPRPIVQWEVEKFGEKARILFTVRPGVTGLWQVEGGNELSYDQRVVLNSYYIEHWSPLLDVIILAKTAWIVIVDVFSKLVGHKKEGSTY